MTDVDDRATVSTESSSSASPAPISPAPSFWKAFPNAFQRHYNNFDGRATRREFWGYATFTLLIFAALVVWFSPAYLKVLTSPDDAFARARIRHTIWIFAFAAFYFFSPTVSICARRLHDFGWSARKLLWAPLAVWIPSFVAAAFDFVSADVDLLERFCALRRSGAVFAVIVFAVFALYAVALVYTALVAVYLGFKRGDVGPNKYGDAPRAESGKDDKNAAA